MTFADFPNGAEVFLDTNTIVYHFSRHPQYGSPCTDLMERIARQELVGYTATHVVGDAAHRLMTLEAIHRFGWPGTGIGNRLRRHPSEVKQLTQFRQAVDEIPLFGIQVFSISPAMISGAAGFCRLHGLLINDALIVGVMQDNRLVNLASADADFDRVPGLNRYAPV